MRAMQKSPSCHTRNQHQRDVKILPRPHYNLRQDTNASALDTISLVMRWLYKPSEAGTALAQLQSLRKTRAAQNAPFVALLPASY